MADSDAKIEAFLDDSRHTLGGLREPLRMLLATAREAGLLNEILELHPPVAILCPPASENGWTRVFPAELLKKGLRLMVVDPALCGAPENTAAVLGHELGHAFHGHVGRGGLDAEKAADAKCAAWGLGAALLQMLEGEACSIASNLPPEPDIAVPDDLKEIVDLASLDLDAPERRLESQLRARVGALRNSKPST